VRPLRRHKEQLTTLAGRALERSCGPSALVATATRSDDGINQIGQKNSRDVKRENVPGEDAIF
jgi:hypothetical protein